METTKKLEKKKVSRRNFIAVSTVSAATLAVGGVGSAIASKKKVSPNVANLLAMALAEDDFRQALRKDPQAAARSRGINLSREDVGIIQGILAPPKITPGRVGPGALSAEPPPPCPYRGFN